MTSAPQFDPITFQVLWSRAINIADEMATTLVQTAFSTVVRDNHDFAVGIYDAKGDLIAQANQSTPPIAVFYSTNQPPFACLNSLKTSKR